MTNELLELFAEALEVEPSSLTPDSSISDYAEWNSLAWLTIMSMVDDKYNVQLSATEIRSFKTVQEVIENISGKVTPTNLAH
jgi:acyl carrier protein